MELNMNKAEFNREKKRVEKDFDEALNTIFQTSSRNDTQHKDSEDLFLSMDRSISRTSTIKDSQTGRPAYRSKSATKFEKEANSSFFRPRHSLLISPTKPFDEDEISRLLFQKIDGRFQLINRNEDDSNSTNFEGKDEELQPDTKQLNIQKYPFDVMKRKKEKSSKILQRFFPSFDYCKIPFERTSITSLQYYLPINIEHKGQILVTVTEMHTIDSVKAKIFRRENIEIKHQAIFFNDNRLEGSNILYRYGITSKSQLHLKLCNLITVNGKYNLETIPLQFYTSVTIKKMKDKFAERIRRDPGEIELKFNCKILNGDKELFVYSILDGNEIQILERSRCESPSDVHPLFEQFHKMTDNLKKCKCQRLRIDAMVNLLKLSLDDCNPKEEIELNKKQLEEFDKNRNYHHIYCFKLTDSRSTSRSQSRGSSFSNFTSTSYSGSESSLKSVVFAENKRIARKSFSQEEDKFVKQLAKSREFNVFKHLLKYKIGTKCNVKSVAYLYKYAHDMVRYIGLYENENNRDVDKMIKFTKMYFGKYFLTYIVNKGGLDALTLSVSDID